MSDETKNHQRAEKTTTYLAGAGTLSTGLWALGMTLTFPIVSIVGIAGLAYYATTEKGRNNFQKLGDQLVNLGQDLVSHVSEDFGRVKNWWNARKERKALEKKESIERATSTFKNGTVEPGFNNAAKPEVAPAAAVETPKLVNVPKPPQP
ncbi:MAG: hypothetical protein K0R10_1296 [Alphaproteobacteria bacterium]|jgi:hypothetical protein|nr:hypothetical protein [Alphaproteobacteria bacterium]